MSRVILFFKQLTVISIFVYFIFNFQHLKLNVFEFYTVLPTLILSFLLICSIYYSLNELITVFLSIEIQTLFFYIIVSSKNTKQSNSSVEIYTKYFILGSLSTAFFLFGTTFIYRYSFLFQVIFLNLFFLVYFYKIFKNLNTLDFKIIIRSNLILILSAILILLSTNDSATLLERYEEYILENSTPNLIENSIESQFHLIIKQFNKKIFKEIDLGPQFFPFELNRAFLNFNDNNTIYRTTGLLFKMPNESLDFKISSLKDCEYEQSLLDPLGTNVKMQIHKEGDTFYKTYCSLIDQNNIPSSFLSSNKIFEVKTEVLSVKKSQGYYLYEAYIRPYLQTYRTINCRPYENYMSLERSNWKQMNEDILRQLSHLYSVFGQEVVSYELSQAYLNTSKDCEVWRVIGTISKKGSYSCNSGLENLSKMFKSWYHYYDLDDEIFIIVGSQPEIHLSAYNYKELEDPLGGVKQLSIKLNKSKAESLFLKSVVDINPDFQKKWLKLKDSLISPKFYNRNGDFQNKKFAVFIEPLNLSKLYDKQFIKNIYNLSEK